MLWQWLGYSASGDKMFWVKKRGILPVGKRILRGREFGASLQCTT
jgi:hypothetical protein